MNSTRPGCFETGKHVLDCDRAGRCCCRSGSRCRCAKHNICIPIHLKQVVGCSYRYNVKPPQAIKIDIRMQNQTQRHDFHGLHRQNDYPTTAIPTHGRNSRSGATVAGSSSSPFLVVMRTPPPTLAPNAAPLSEARLAAARLRRFALDFLASDTAPCMAVNSADALRRWMKRAR